MINKQSNKNENVNIGRNMQHIINTMFYYTAYTLDIKENITD